MQTVFVLILFFFLPEGPQGVALGALDSLEQCEAAAIEFAPLAPGGVPLCAEIRVAIGASA